MAPFSGLPGPGNGTYMASGKLDRPRGAPKSARRNVRRRGCFSSAFSLLARLSIWAVVLTIIFRCPENLEACDEDSPYVCRHYFQARNALLPYVEPYYEHYAAPYVEVARPYYDAVDSHVISPVCSYVTLHGGPWLNKGQQFVWLQWETKGKPRLERLQHRTYTHYNETIAPYVNKGLQIIGPQCYLARTLALRLYGEVLLPSYDFLVPYAVKGGHASSTFVRERVLPTGRRAWARLSSFFDTTVWPQLRVVYRENVEPQLVRIGERLGRYKNKAKPMRSSSDNSPSDSQPATEPVSEVSSNAGATPARVPEKVVAKDSEAVSKDSDPQQELPKTADSSASSDANDKAGHQTAGQNTREMVARDLALWQKKFLAETDEGVVEVENRIDRIAQNIMETNARQVGRKLLDELEATVNLELAGVENKISALAAEDAANTEDYAVEAIRSAGAAVKKRAQKIRIWRKDYDVELEKSIGLAADAELQLLDETRALALQHIGMKWAWAEGITPEDWKQYHQQKEALVRWNEDFRKNIVNRVALLEAQEAAALIEDEGMAMAAAAAQKLARWKEVARLSILARGAGEKSESPASSGENATPAKGSENANETRVSHAEYEAASTVDMVQKGSALPDLQDATDQTKNESVSHVTEAVDEETPFLAASTTKSAEEENGDIGPDSSDLDDSETSHGYGSYPSQGAVDNKAEGVWKTAKDSTSAAPIISDSTGNALESGTAMTESLEKEPESTSETSHIEPEAAVSALDSDELEDAIFTEEEFVFVEED